MSAFSEITKAYNTGLKAICIPNYILIRSAVLACLSNKHTNFDIYLISRKGRVASPNVKVILD